MSPYVAAAVTCWAVGTVVATCFWVGRGKLVNDWRTYCADYAAEHDQARLANEPLHREHSEQLWAELERMNKGAGQ